MVIIRDAVFDDAPSLYHLNSASMDYEYPKEKTSVQLEKLLSSSRDKILVAELDNQVVGYLHLVDYDLLYFGPMKNIMGIAVDPKYRRMDIGKALLEAGEEWARESGAKGVRLVSGEGRTEAHAYYREIWYDGNKKQLN